MTTEPEKEPYNYPTVDDHLIANYIQHDAIIASKIQEGHITLTDLTKAISYQPKLLGHMGHAPGPDLVQNHRNDFMQLIKHPVSEREDNLQSIIISLNDKHLWSREQIADWLDTLDTQPIFYPDTHPDDCAGCDECTVKLMGNLPTSTVKVIHDDITLAIDTTFVTEGIKDLKKSIELSAKSFETMKKAIQGYAEQAQLYSKKSFGKNYLYGLEVKVNNDLGPSEFKINGIPDKAQEQALADMVMKVLNESYADSLSINTEPKHHGFLIADEAINKCSPYQLACIEKHIIHAGGTIDYQLDTHSHLVTLKNSSHVEAQKLQNKIMKEITSVHSYSKECFICATGYTQYCAKHASKHY